MTIGTPGGGLVTTIYNYCSAQPLRVAVVAVVVPAIIATLVCGPSVYAKVFTKDCIGDKVAVASDGWADWVGKSGDFKFQVANNPLPKNLCVVEVPKGADAAFAADQKLAWADYNKWLANKG